ncbi:MAG TPA: AAA family ATPase [Candidatus Binatia bacterium]|nr:AAA family ATPase [Candidatus Binatia bacterium]
MSPLVGQVSSPDVAAAADRLRAVAGELARVFVERTEVLEGALAALIARQHVLLVGPPGTAKSMLADELCRRIDGATYFQWLLTKFTTPEEVFGAVSLRALENDEYRRVTTGKLPEAHVAFLDEVFKASSSILNALLTILNERRFHNGGRPLDVPLLSLFGAANELPEEEELAAVYDRFLVRFVVGYVAEDWRFLRMLAAPAPDVGATLSLADVRSLQAAAERVEIPDAVLRSIVEVRRALQGRDLTPSDRRFRQSLSLMRALALVRGKARVGDDELLFLEHVLWRDPSERDTVREVLRQLVHGFDEEVQEIVFQGRELGEYAQREWDSLEQRARARIEVETKLRNLLRQLDEIERRAREAGRSVGRAGDARSELEAIRAGLAAGA